MGTHYSFTDAEFQQQFKDCTLDSSLFTHEAHLRLAWILIRRYGIDKAIEQLRQQLKNHIEHNGAKGKYNETVTVAGARVINRFMLHSKTNNFKDFIHENPRLKYNFKDLLSSHYSTDIFTTEIAKQEYLQPELLPFD